MTEERQTLQRIVENVEQSVIGKRRAVELTVAALACGGHVLFEDVPGVGKTSLAAALAQSVDGSFSRIQFTPDILPSDITGFSVYNPKEGRFDFRPGPVFSHFVLADEINRTSPKTQASLLEIMEEGQATVDAHTYPLPAPFMVLATQNPVEYLGTYPLPEAQIDRFLIRVTLGYPAYEEEVRILAGGRAPVRAPVATCEDVLRARKAAEQVRTDESILRYIVSIVAATRQSGAAALGASPRGSLSLLRLSRAWALLHGRDFVTPDDVRTLCMPVLAHRVVPAARTQPGAAEAVVRQAMETGPAPPVERIG